MNVGEWEKRYTAAKRRYDASTASARRVRFTNPASADEFYEAADRAVAEMCQLMTSRPAEARIKP